MEVRTIRRGDGDRAPASRRWRRRFAANLAAATLVAILAQGCSVPHGEAPPPEPPSTVAGRTGVRLVLQITVDQFRADLVLQTRDRWSRDGLRRLYDEGVVFSDAHHGHANTETIVGHATLATGADPSVHGMVGNVWFDRAKGGMHYNVEDPRFDIVGVDRAATGAAGHPEVTKEVHGRSPEEMLAPTIADSIAQAGGGQAKVFAVSLKDRAAVPMAGRSGKALWWSDATGEFISSTYYYPDRRLPAWAVAWNDTNAADRFDGRSWTLLLDPKSYRSSSRDDMPWEEPPAGMARTFPHRFERSTLADGFYAAVAASPFGDDVLLDFTRALVSAESIGHDDVTDYLSVAFSSCDYIGHRYGPSSLEYEDEILRMDRAIAALLRAADEAAGPGRTLVVLSSDHGVADAPQALAAAGRDAGKVVLSTIEADEAVTRLTAKFGGKLIRHRWPPYVYLDVDALRARGVNPELAARELAAEIAKAPGVEAVFTRGQILRTADGKLPDTGVARAVRRSFHPARSGDIYVVPKPGWQIAYEGSSTVRYATGHGTPWRYDTFVPLVIAGPGVSHAVVSRRVEAIDVAPTIAALVGVESPSRSSGHVLAEALR